MISFRQELHFYKVGFEGNKSPENSAELALKGVPTVFEAAEHIEVREQNCAIFSCVCDER